tara:strand:- start:655 stop:789 length:135 start_codon:yes stop_codon:yes gene_type:complete
LEEELHQDTLSASQAAIQTDVSIEGNAARGVRLDAEDKKLTEQY